MKNPIFHMVYVEAPYANVRADFQSPRWAEFFELAAETGGDMQHTILRYDAAEVDTSLWRNLGQKNGWLVEVEYQERDSHYG